MAKGPHMFKMGFKEKKENEVLNEIRKIRSEIKKNPKSCRLTPVSTKSKKLC